MEPFKSSVKCRDCGKPIVFVPNEKGKLLPYNAVTSGNGEYIAQGLHICPEKARRRIEEHCIGCQLDKGRSIFDVWDLVDYMRCEKHSDTNRFFHFRGRTYNYTRESLLMMYKEAKKEERRRKEREGEPSVMPLDAF